MELLPETRLGLESHTQQRGRGGDRESSGRVYIPKAKELLVRLLLICLLITQLYLSNVNKMHDMFCRAFVHRVL